MKRTIKFLTAVILPVIFLTSCEAHLGPQKYEVEWYVVTVPTVLVIAASLVITGIVLSKKTYVCPKCGHRFRPKWYQAAISVHAGSDRLFKCPNCGNRGFCRKED